MKNLIVFLALISIFSISSVDKTDNINTSLKSNDMSTVDETYLRITIERMRRPERFYNKKFTA